MQLSASAIVAFLLLLVAVCAEAGEAEWGWGPPWHYHSSRPGEFSSYRTLSVATSALPSTSAVRSISSVIQSTGSAVQQSSSPSSSSPAQCSSSAVQPPTASPSTWSGWGGNVYNNRWAPGNMLIKSNIVSTLIQHCRIPFAKGVSATPTILGDIAYFPTWNGLFVALNYKTCSTQWQINVTSLVIGFAPLSGVQQGLSRPVSRTSPQIEDGVLYFATLAHALLFAVRADTGAVLGSIQINPHPLAILTMSPTVFKGRIFIGAASQEESAAEFVPGYPCCTFVGNFAALTFDRAANRFAVAWNVSMLPLPAGDWSGAAVWGSQPAIDESRSQVFIATGNVYTLPEKFEACQNESQSVQVVAEGLTVDPCLPPDVYQETVMAFDMESGLINWANQLTPLDSWTLACGVAFLGIPRNPAICPYEPGLDADFGMAPTFVPGGPGTPYAKDTVVIGQKNGNLYALSAQAGRPFWSTVTGPDGPQGGLIWGIAVTDSQVFFTTVNTDSRTFAVQPSGQNISNSAFGSASLTNGSILWEIPSPNNSFSVVPPSVAGDVAFFGVTDTSSTTQGNGTHGALLAVNARSGQIIRQFPLDANFHGGIAIQDRFVLFGSGYSGYTGNASFWVMESAVE